jgi:hypothetical protein
MREARLIDTIVSVLCAPLGKSDAVLKKLKPGQISEMCRLSYNAVMHFAKVMCALAVLLCYCLRSSIAVLLWLGLDAFF